MKIENIIRRVLREAVGVPQNIDVVAEKIYHKILDLYPEHEFDGQDEMVIDFNLTELIGDEETETFNITITYQIYPGETDTELEGMVLVAKQIKDLESKSLLVDDDFFSDIRLKMRFVVGRTTPDIKKSIYDTIQKDSPEIISAIAHEIKHAYDLTKRKSEKFTEKIPYNITQKIKFPINEINKFVFFLYYSHIVENLVRPTELYTKFKQMSVTKKTFIVNLIEENMFNLLKQLQTYSFDKFRNGLMDEIYDVKRLINDLYNANGKNTPNFTDDEYIDTLIQILHINITNKLYETAGEMILDTDPLQILIHSLSNLDSEEILKSVFSKIDSRKYTPEEYVKKEIKYFNKVGDMIIRKISKISSILPESELNEKWSNQYKRSIDCSNPKGFSQKAHCQARKKRKSGGKTKSSSPFK
jgi:hypothetical protein